MIAGLSPAEISYLQANVFDPLAQLGAQVWCFGSRAKGTYQRYSDIDLLVDHPTADLRDIISSIAETLQKGNLPYRVDIVQRRDLARSYLSTVNAEAIKVVG